MEKAVDIDYGLLDDHEVFPMGGRIACQGVRGAYSAIAAKRMFPEGELMFFKNFDAVCEAVCKTAQSGDLIITLGCGDVNKLSKQIADTLRARAEG